MKFKFKSLNQYTALLCALLCIFLYYLYFLGDSILSPNSFMNSIWEDGIKNYYTFAYQTAHSGTSLHFSGMNYPYGEHVIYTDGMPLFGFIFGWMPFLKGYEVGVVNVIIFGSVFIATYVVWKIFMQLKVNSWIAGAGVVGIILLSPQFYRFTGHYALSIMWVIPLVILQLLKLFESEQTIKRSVILLVVLFLLFFIHPYLGLMSLVFVVLTIFMFFLWKRFDWKLTVSAIGIVALSAIFFKLILLFTDTHLDRTTKPSGLFDHYAMPETVFVPYFSPFKSILEFFIPVKNSQPFEGWGYIGFSVILLLLGAFILWIVKLIRRKGGRPAKQINPIKPIFAAACVVLLFSMLIPLKWFPEEFVYQLKVFNQFRSVGRFSWIFYYVAGISAVVILQRMYQKSKGGYKVLAISAVALFPLLAVMETWEAYSFFSSNLGKQKNLFLRHNLKENRDWLSILEKIEAEKNVVILPLPFFHVGSEHTFSIGTPEIQQLSFVMSFHSGSPMLASMMSRTSVSETTSLFKLLAPAFNGPTNIKNFNNRNILVLSSNEGLDKYEAAIVNESQILFKGEKFSLYKLNYSDFEKKELEKVKNQRLKLNEKHLVVDGFNLSDSAFFSKENFNHLKSDHVFAGNGALTVKKSVYSFLATLPSRGDSELEASFWYYKGKTGLYNAMVIVEEIDTITNAGTWIHVADPKEFPILKEEWVLVEIPVVMRKGPYKYNLLIVGDQKSKEHFILDNLIIKQKGLTFSTRSKEWCPAGFELFNNVPFKPRP